MQQEEFLQDDEMVEKLADSDDVYVGQQPNRHQNHFCTDFDFRMKNDIPEFYGNIDIEEYLDWKTAADNFFIYQEIPDDKKVKMVA